MIFFQILCLSFVLLLICNLSQSSGSGSESCTQTQKSIKSKNVEMSGNNTGSNDEDDNGSIGLNGGDGSDGGSGTQVFHVRWQTRKSCAVSYPIWNKNVQNVWYYICLLYFCICISVVLSMVFLTYGKGPLG